jgi:Uma2 family endonuclease
VLEGDDMAMLQVDGLQIPFAARTLDGFREWCGGLGEHAPRASFISGNVYVEMTPQSYRTHAPIVKAINRVLMELGEDSGRGEYYWSPSWITCDEAGLSTEPDGFFASKRTLERGLLRVHPKREHEMVGRPDFVLEVVSKSSPQKDVLHLRRAYARAGVREYWIVDALEHEPQFSMLVLRRGRYREVAPDAQGWRTSPFWRRAFRLRPAKGVARGVAYRLDVREPT